MTKETKIANQAIDKLKNYSNLPIETEKKDSGVDFFININNYRFLATVKTAISNGNKVSAYSRLASDKSKMKYPLLIISGYIPLDIAQEYTEAGINYLDTAGNCHIKYKELAVVIAGKKKDRLIKTNQSRAFQEAGVKLIFHLINDPSNLHLPYRKLAEIANVSLGSVGTTRPGFYSRNRKEKRPKKYATAPGPLGHRLSRRVETPADSEKNEVHKPGTTS
jgi:hypothetical protein